MKAQESSQSHQETAKQKAKELDIRQDRLEEEIKHLKDMVQQGQDRLKTYQLKANPGDVTQLERENDLLKKEVVSQTSQPGPDLNRFTVKDYSSLKSAQSLLVQKIQEKTTYLRELQKKVDGMNSQEMCFERENQQMQFEIASMDPIKTQDDDYANRHRVLEQKYQSLEAEYMRLYAMLRAGQNIDAEIRAYSWALKNQTEGLQAVPF